MGKWEKFRAKLLGGRSDQSIKFSELCGFLHRIGFEERIRGDHHIFTMDGIAEIINLQPLPNGYAKAYQVEQVRKIINDHGL